MRDVGDAGAALVAEQQAILRLLRVVARVGGHHRSRIRRVVNHLREGVREEELVMLRESLVNLQDKRVIAGIGVALELTDAAEEIADSADGPGRAGRARVSQEGRNDGARRRRYRNRRRYGRRQLDVA